MVAGISSSASAMDDQALAPQHVGQRAGERRGGGEASVPAVMTRLASAAPTPNSCAIMGSTDCGA